MSVRGVRGATTVPADDPDAIRSATMELLSRMLTANGLEVDDLISIIFTTTPDITSDFPAHAARSLGWAHVPLLGAVEMATSHGVPRCIRVLMHVETTRRPAQIAHVYLEKAKSLRPDR